MNKFYFLRLAHIFFRLPIGIFHRQKKLAFDRCTIQFIEFIRFDFACGFLTVFPFYKNECFSPVEMRFLFRNLNRIDLAIVFHSSEQMLSLRVKTTVKSTLESNRPKYICFVCFESFRFGFSSNRKCHRFSPIDIWNFIPVDAKHWLSRQRRFHPQCHFTFISINDKQVVVVRDICAKLFYFLRFASVEFRILIALNGIT